MNDELAPPNGSPIGDDYVVEPNFSSRKFEILKAFQSYFENGTHVNVEYRGSPYTGTIIEYYQTSSGTWAMQIRLDDGLNIKDFLATYKPAIKPT